jgi:hypothetical protein
MMMHKIKEQAKSIRGTIRAVTHPPVRASQEAGVGVGEAPRRAGPEGSGAVNGGHRSFASGDVLRRKEAGQRGQDEAEA